MKIYNFKRQQKIPISIEEAWAFFSNPKNLSKITPPDLGFKITSEVSDKMYAGMIISYLVKPVLGVPLTWFTEITQAEAPNYFIDNQLQGPYKIWHHQHFFEKVDDGVLMTDIIHYALPFGIIGRMIHPLLVLPQLKKIFEFRKIFIEREFSENKHK